MKLTVVGIQRITGKAKATGNPFDMCNVMALEPVENFSKDTLTIQGHGFKVQEYSCDHSLLNELAGMKFPTSLDVTFDHKPRGGRVEAVISGLVKAA